MKKIRLEKDTTITFTWLEIKITKKEIKYYGETCYKQTGRIRHRGGAIASLRHFLYEKIRGGYERKDKGVVGT